MPWSQKEDLEVYRRLHLRLILLLYRDVSESRPFFIIFVRLALVIVCPPAWLVGLPDYCPRVPSTILLGYSLTQGRSEPKIFFGAEALGSFRFSPLRLPRRRKWARNFLAFLPWSNENLTRAKASLQWNNQIEKSLRAQMKYHTAIRVTRDNWR